MQEKALADRGDVSRLCPAISKAHSPLMANTSVRPPPEANADRDRASAQTAQWIIAIAQHRDQSAFRQLFRSLAPRLKSYLMRHGLCDAAAEDLAQETLVAVWCKADQFDPARGRAETWIFTIARNRRIDAIRWRRSPEALPLDFAAPVSTPEELATLVDEKRQVRQALTGLSPTQADLVHRSFYGDDSHGKIAQDLGIPLGTVKSRLRTAARQLRLTLKACISAA